MKKGRSVNGILILDKPLHDSSNRALQKCKRLFNAKKAGHTGSLDPLATGMLPLCFGHATKFAQYLLDSDKVYVTTIRLGQKTTTGDAEGEILEEKPVPKLSEELLESVLSQFRGEIQQCPPMYSALKHEGRPLYELARQGIEVERPLRTVMIHRCELESFDEISITLLVACSKGTYIRTLAEDIGEALGCGATVIALRRTSVAGIPESAMMTIEALEEKAKDLALLDGCMMPVDVALRHWPEYLCIAGEDEDLRHGRPIITQDESYDNGLLRLYSRDRQFMGLGEINDRCLRPIRLIA